MIAVIRTGGKQYRVREGDTMEVEKLAGEVGEFIDFREVLLASVDGKVSVGTPALPGAKVVAEIKDQTKADKLTVFKYKPKTRRRVKKGHRQQLTSVQITAIAAS